MMAMPGSLGRLSHALRAEDGQSRCGVLSLSSLSAGGTFGSTASRGGALLAFPRFAASAHRAKNASGSSVMRRRLPNRIERGPRPSRQSANKRVRPIPAEWHQISMRYFAGRCMCDGLGTHRGYCCAGPGGPLAAPKPPPEAGPQKRRRPPKRPLRVLMSLGRSASSSFRGGRNECGPPRTTTYASLRTATSPTERIAAPRRFCARVSPSSLLVGHI